MDKFPSYIYNVGQYRYNPQTGYIYVRVFFGFYRRMSPKIYKYLEGIKIVNMLGHITYGGY